MVGDAVLRGISKLLDMVGGIFADSSFTFNINDYGSAIEFVRLAFFWIPPDAVVIIGLLLLLNNFQILAKLFYKFILRS